MNDKGSLTQIRQKITPFLEIFVLAYLAHRVLFIGLFTFSSLKISFWARYRAPHSDSIVLDKKRCTFATACVSSTVVRISYQPYQQFIHAAPKRTKNKMLPKTVERQKKSRQARQGRPYGALGARWS